MINKEQRKYHAVCHRAPTILYVLKKQIFATIIEKYFTRVVEACKINIKIKSKWREERIKQGKRNDGSPGNRLEKSKDKMTIRTTRLLDPNEAQQLNIRLNRPELVFQTNMIKVVNFEARDSRNIKTKVEITTCDPDKKPESATLQKKAVSPLQLKLKKFTKTKESKSHRGLKPHKEEDAAIEKIKSKLYEKAQGFSLAVHLNNLHSQYRSTANNSVVTTPGSPKSHPAHQNSNKSPPGSPTRSSSQTQLFALLNPHSRPRLNSAHFAKTSLSNNFSEITPNDCMTPNHLNKQQSEPFTILNEEVNLSHKSVKMFQRIKSFQPRKTHQKNSQSLINHIGSLKVTSLCPSPKSEHTAISKFSSTNHLNFSTALSKMDSPNNSIKSSKTTKKVSFIARNLATAAAGDRKIESEVKPYLYQNTDSPSSKGHYILNRGKEEPKSVFAELNFSARFTRQHSAVI